MYLTVSRADIINTSCYIPSSKPETQRGIIVGALAGGESIIHNDLRCLETTIMKEVFTSLGAEFFEEDNKLRIKGINNKIKFNNTLLDAQGSALVFRVAAAITSISGCAIPLTGDKTLRVRVMKPLFIALAKLGARIDYLGDEYMAPIINWGSGIAGGECVIEGDVSSQFISALMFVAPLSAQGIELHVSGSILSKSYIHQTIEFMQKSAIDVTYTPDLSYIKISPGKYQAIEVTLSGDMTSASYFLALATLFKGNYVFQNISKSSLQGEKYFIEIIQKLGVDVQFDEGRNELKINNPLDELFGDYAFDISDCPNIIPTLAALGTFVTGKFQVSGGSITRLHKSNRIQAMYSELTKLGVDMGISYKEGIMDGFIIYGKSTYSGGQTLSSWGDHRIFMSLFIV
jgi:3-phosphoshikimate 1-carboxyvinyltransferase